jgi:hypothetical protein
MRNYVPHGRQRERNISRKLFGAKLHGRAHITNGNGLLPGVDKRSLYARRFRDLIELHISDLGGLANCSTAECSLVRRVATIAIELEHLEGRFARAEGATLEELQAYCGASSVLNRLLATIGLRRRPRDVSLDLGQYLDAQSPQPPIDGTPIDLDASPGS